MDPKKLQAVLDWSQPLSLKAIQRFLGFANYYRRFIHAFSVLVAPIVTLTKKGADPSNWPPSAMQAFEALKRAFVSAPVLKHPNPELPFIVEVDASELGVGAILSQKDPDSQHLHPCAFLSRKFSTAEANYDVGNRELLAIKWSFDEWRHWLEGAKHLITVITDHKNLQYIEAAKRLNSRQARWALFFTRFRFVITYRPGSQNIQADALSRCFSPVQDGRSQDTPIVPPKVILAAISQDMHSQLLPLQDQAPDRTPSGRLFVPESFRAKVLEEFHSLRPGGHPGIAKTIELVSRSLWWPELQKDVKEFVSSCLVCAQHKVSRASPIGQLVPLPVPSKPWTHISMDFIVDLPVSSGCQVIWVVVDRFSKMAHFVALPQLPSAKGLSTLFLRHIFRCHGLPQDIVSDRGPQFIAVFWRNFCSALGIKTSLTSGYHPQSNGQC